MDKLLNNVYKAAVRAGHGWTMHPAAECLVRAFAARWEEYAGNDSAWEAFADVAHALELARAQEKYVLGVGYTPKNYEFTYFFGADRVGVQWESLHGRLVVYVTGDGIRVAVRRPAGHAFVVSNLGGAITAEYTGIPIHYGVLRGLEQAIWIATGNAVALAGRVPALGWGSDDEDWPELPLSDEDWSAIQFLVTKGGDI